MDDFNKLAFLIFAPIIVTSLCFTIWMCLISVVSILLISIIAVISVFIYGVFIYGVFISEEC